MNEKTSAELQHDAELARAKVSDTAESIRNKMTPGQLIDEFSGMFTGEGSGSLLTTLKTQVQGNPLPVALVGVGLAWLMAGQRTSPDANASNRPYPSGMSSPTVPDAERFDERPDGPGYLGDIKDSATGVASRASSLAGNAAETISAKVSGVAHDISDQASVYATATSDQAARAGSAAADLLREEPLVLAALGLALGTAIGALLPRTEIEDTQVGEISDRVRNQATKILQQGVKEARDVAAQAYQTVKDEADKKGLTGDGGTLVDQVKDVVQATFSQTEENVRDKLNKVADHMPGSET